MVPENAQNHCGDEVGRHMLKDYKRKNIYVYITHNINTCKKCKVDVWGLILNLPQILGYSFIQKYGEMINMLMTVNLRVQDDVILQFDRKRL